MTAIPSWSAHTRAVVTVAVSGASGITLTQVARRTGPASVTGTALTLALAVDAFYRAQLYTPQYSTMQ